MTESSFLAYIGGPDIHDGFIRGLSKQGNLVRVTVEGASGRRFIVEFHGVSWVEAHNAEDMMLYALAEARSEKLGRHFVFINWNEDDDAKLEIGADNINIDYEAQERDSK
jgi:hypothetical protein